MLEYEKLQQVDIRTPAVGAFADSLLALRGISPLGMSPNAKALALYRDDALSLLRRMMASRDKALGEYMLTTHGVQAPAFRLQPMDSVALTNYTGATATPSPWVSTARPSRSATIRRMPTAHRWIRMIRSELKSRQRPRPTVRHSRNPHNRNSAKQNPSGISEGFFIHRSSE